MFVSVKIDGSGNVLEEVTFETLQHLDILNLARKIYNIKQFCTLKEISKTREGFHTGDCNETTLHKWEPMDLKYSKF